MKSSSSSDLQKFMLTPTKFPLSRVFLCRLESSAFPIKKCRATIIGRSAFLPQNLYVRLIGLEPTRCEALDPKSSVSTNFTTSARKVVALLAAAKLRKKVYIEYYIIEYF